MDNMTVSSNKLDVQIKPQREKKYCIYSWNERGTGYNESLD